MFPLVREGLRDALAVLLPVDCAGCGAADRTLCADCLALLRVESACPLPAQVLTDGTQVVSAVRYESHVRSMILELKEHGRTDVVKALARPLRAAIQQAAEQAALQTAVRAEAGNGQRVELCTVPSSKQSLRRRGYRPVELLARAAGFRHSAVLIHAAVTQEQKSLDRAQRGANLVGAFVAKPSARGRSFVIIDDVVTSGATLLEASRALREVGARVMSAATLAFTPRRIAEDVDHLSHARDIHRHGGYGG